MRELLRRRPFGNLAVRLLAVMVVVALASIAATAWLAVQTTENSMHRQQHQTLEGDTKVYNTLLEYAATHRSWKEVVPLLEALAADTGREITLTRQDGTTVAATSAGHPPSATAEIDPLNVNPALAKTGTADGIDDRVAGPFELTEKEKSDLRRVAYLAIDCLVYPKRPTTYAGIEIAETAFRIQTDPFDGRPQITGSRRNMELLRNSQCYQQSLTGRAPSQEKSFTRWKTLTIECMTANGIEDPIVDPPPKSQGRDVPDTYFSNTTRNLDVSGNSDPKIADGCVVSARKEMLRGSSAPPVSLYLGGDGLPGLGDVGRRKTVMVAGLVFLVAVTAAWFASRRLTRPIGVLTEATTKMGGGDHSVRVGIGSSGELGRLGEAFNTMAGELERNERNRQSVMSDVAHELRNPLANITGWLEAAEDGVAELDKDLVGFLMGEAQTLQRLVNDLQDLALAEAGRLTLHPEELSLPELLDQVATAHRSRSPEIEIEVKAEPVTLTADPVRLRQIVGNLVGNALRHTAPGGTVVLTATEHGICVADTGSGISPDHLPHVFDRFWRADRSRNRSTGGAGLGLAITKQLVEAHGYTITVSSTLGEGSTFTVHFG